MERQSIMHRWIAGVVLAVALAALPVAAQETTPAVGTNSARFFPPAARFGDEWIQTEEAGLDLPSDIFREGSMAVYAGPDGARITILAYLATDDRVAVRRSWETAGETFDRYRYNLADNYDYQQAERLEAMEPPVGCVEAKRAEGTDDFYSFTTGVTMCAVDPDAILLVAASGAVEDETGVTAADQVILIALEMGTDV